VEIEFTRSSRRHRIGRASARFVIATAKPVDGGTLRGCPSWWFIGPDERGRELEILAVQTQGDNDPEPVLLVIHVMPTNFGKEQQ
jgi:hypothetical protein